ncbi:NAD(P)H-hydrate epimerase [Pantoea ananatis]
MAIDLPSGLSAATGNIPGEVINATHTLSVIALKPGQLTGKARDCIGSLYFADLGLQSFRQRSRRLWPRYDARFLSHWLKPRRATSHKGDQGRLLVMRR